MRSGQVSWKKEKPGSDLSLQGRQEKVRILEWFPSTWARALVICIQTMQPWILLQLQPLSQGSHISTGQVGNLSWWGHAYCSTAHQSLQLLALLRRLIYSSYFILEMNVCFRTWGPFTSSQQCLKICFSPVCRNPACKLLHHFQLRIAKA